MDKEAKIYVAGHKGLVGSSLVRELNKEGYSNILTRSRNQLNLLNQNEATEFFNKEKPEYVFLAAARVGGISANNTYSADFIYENLQVQNNVIHNAYLTKVKKLLFLGSSCIYPRNCPQPIKEEYLLSGILESTNEAYAIAKIAGIKLCQNYNKQYKTNFICVMPTNLYGPNDSFDPDNSHVIPGLIQRIYKAKVKDTKSVTLWGTGTAYREFLYIDDLANACVFLMNNYSSSEIINIGAGEDLTIKDLAQTISKVIDYKGELIFDHSMPDGTPKKLLDTNKLNTLGWTKKTNLITGLEKTYKWYLDNIAAIPAHQ